MRNFTWFFIVRLSSRSKLVANGGMASPTLWPTLVLSAMHLLKLSTEKNPSALHFDGLLCNLRAKELISVPLFDIFTKTLKALLHLALILFLFHILFFSLCSLFNSYFIFLCELFQIKLTKAIKFWPWKYLSKLCLHTLVQKKP